MLFSFSNFGDGSFNNDKQNDSGVNELSHNEGDHSVSGDAINETNESTASTAATTTTAAETASADTTPTPKAANEERAFPRIQIKSPSKLAQEFSEKQKQTDLMTTSSNEINRTNNNKTSVDLNTTPLYDEPAENRSYSLKEPTPSSHSFDTQQQNHDALASTTDTNTIVTETDNCDQ